MNAKQWMKTGMLALLLGSWSFPSLTTAAIVKTESLATTCSEGCVDTWQVDCTDGNTHEVKARVASYGDESNSFTITTLGYKNPTALIGQADQERATSNNEGFYSPGAFLIRTGTTHGATSALVLVHPVKNVADALYGYTVEFSCYDVNNVQLANPTITLLQDQ